MKKKRPRSPPEGDLLEQTTTDSMIVNPVPNAKKRFVWPSTLHQDFIGAVFDVGLRYSTVNEVLSCLKNNPNLSSIFSPHGAPPLVINPSFTESLRSYILKYQLFRDRKYNPRLYFYDLDQRSHSPSNFNRGGKLSSRSFEEEDEPEERNPGLSSQDLTTADHSYSTFSLNNSNSDFDRVPSSGNNNQISRDVHEARQKIQKQQKEILFRQNQKYIGKLEKECQELLKVIHNHWIKIEFLMKLEQDMAQEMKELIHRQTEKKSLLATQIQTTAEQFSSCCPSDSSSSLSTSSSSFLANAVANIRNQVLQTSVYPCSSSSFSSTGTVFLPPPTTVMTTKNNNSLTQKKLAKESSLPLPSSSSSGVAEILESKYRSIMEMKDHIKLHRLLLNKQQSQIHGGAGPSGSNTRINNQRNNHSNTTSSNFTQSNNRNSNINVDQYSNETPFPLRQAQPLPSRSSPRSTSDNYISKHPAHSIPTFSYNNESAHRNNNNNEHNDSYDTDNNINNGNNASQPLVGEGEVTVRLSTPSNEFSSSFLSGVVGGKELNWLEDDFATEEDLFSFLLDP
jgi:uncharacterized protein YeeX (DUF496 family)